MCLGSVCVGVGGWGWAVFCHAKQMCVYGGGGGAEGGQVCISESKVSFHHTGPHHPSQSTARTVLLKTGLVVLRQHGK